MSHREAQQVLDFAEYSGGQLFLLYRVAGLVNSHHDFEYWQDTKVAADELRFTAGTVRKYMSRFVDDGWLEVVEAGGGRGNATRYRWLGVPDGETAPLGALTETAPGVRETAPGVPETAPGVNPLLSTDKKRKQDKTSKRKYSESFEAFWSEYNERKRSIKNKTAEVWKRLSADDRRDAHQLLSLYIADTPDPQFRMAAERYLKDRRWENYVYEGDLVVAAPAFPIKKQVCSTCRGSHWVDGPDDTVLPCPDCSEKPDAVIIQVPTLPSRSDLD